MSTTLIIPDTHLGAGTLLGKPGIGSALNSRLVDQLNILEWILSKAIEFMVSNIVLTGDIFDDSKPHPSVITSFINWLKKCTDNDISVHIIAGNHDVFRSGQFYISPLDIISAADIDNVYVYKHISTLHTQGASFTLIPFRDRRSFNMNSNADALSAMQHKLPYELAEINKSNAKVVVGHLAIEGSIPIGNEVSDSSNELFCPISMFKGYDYVWMGHIHKPQIISKNPFVAHIGSMDISDFSETEQEKYIVIFDTESSETYRYLSIPTRPLKQISIVVPDNITDTTSFIVNEINKYNNIEKSIVKINVSLPNTEIRSPDRTIIDKSLNDKGVFHLFRLNEERKISTVKKHISINMDNSINEITAIKMYADLNIDDKNKNDFIILANSIVEECK